MVLFTALYLLYKKVGLMGVDSKQLLFYYYLFALPLMFAILFISERPFSLSISKTALLLLLLAGLVGVLGNLFIVQSIKLAPNPGYSLAISGANVLLVTIFSVFLFNSEFSIVKWLGVIMTVAGIFLLNLR